MSASGLYERYAIEHHEYVSKIFDRVLKLLKWGKNENILDIGSGTGEVLLKILAPKLPDDIAKLVASDLYEDMAMYCNKKRSMKGEFSSVVLDIECELLPAELVNQFDHIFSTYCFMYVLNKKRALTNCFKLLKPKGELIFIFCTIDILSEVHKLMCKDAKWSPYLSQRKNFTQLFHNIPEPIITISKYFEESGFDVISCDIDFDFKMHYPSVEAIAGVFESFDDGILKIPTSALSNYREDFVKYLLRCEQLKIEIIEGKEKATLAFPTATVVARKILV